MKSLKNCLLALLYPVLSCTAQVPAMTIVPLGVGDHVPDVKITNLYNFPASKIHLSDFSGKPLILDFWAAWCGSCLKAIPSLDSLQREFGDSVQILLVNPKDAGDDRAKVEGTLIKIKPSNVTSICLPVVLNDTELFELFDFSAVPHYVWIDSGGIIRAITESKEVTRENIRSLIKGKSLDLPVKSDTRH